MFDPCTRWRTCQSRKRKYLGNGSTVVHEGVGQDLVDGWSFGWFQDENLGDQVFGLFRYDHVLRKCITIHPYLFVGSLDIWSLEWWFANQQRVYDYPCRPDIHLIRMARLAIKNFRCLFITITLIQCNLGYHKWFFSFLRQTQSY